MALLSIPEADWLALEDEAVGLLQELVKLRTINPTDVTPGSSAVGETVADQMIQQWLERAGIASEILFRDDSPTRGNIIARVPGDGSLKPILLLGHLDVAGVAQSEWSPGIDAFGGQIKDGRIYGRGTADMKDLVVMHVMALLIAKRYGLKLKRDLILAGVADEESGSHLGMKWLVATHWDRIDAEYSFNEGFSGTPMLGRDRKTVIWVGLEAIEKRIVIANVTAKGIAGHASSEQPNNAIYRLAEALARLEQHPRPMVLNPVTEQFARTIKACFGQDLRESTDPGIRAIFHDVVVPTMLEGGTEAIVLPDHATATVTARLLPTTDTKEFAAWLQSVVGLPNVTVSYPHGLPDASPDPSSPDNELVTIYKGAVGRHFGPHVPVILTQGIGTTDSFHLREKGVKAYGIRPLVDPTNESIHGANESIPLIGFKKGMRFFLEVVLGLAT